MYEASAYGVVPGPADVSAALNAAVTAAAATGGVLHVAAGRYEIAQPIRMLNGVRVIGDGAATIFSASISANWARGAALVEFKSVRSAALCNVTLDHRGVDRTTALSTLDFTVLMSNATSNLISGVTFLNAGTTLGSPSGPSLLLAVQQPRCPLPGCREDLACDGGDLGYFGTNATPLEAGNVESNLITGCAWVQDERLETGFAVRMHSNFDCKRAPDDFVYRVQGNVLEKSSFTDVGDGGFFWNTVELAGGGTRNNTIRGNTFAGQTLAHIDFDKGASANLAEANRITSAKLPPADLVSQLSTHAALSDHGSDVDYLSTNNTMRNNTVFSVTSNRPSVSAGIYVQHTRGTVLTGNRVDSVRDGAGGYGVVLVENVQDASLSSNRLGKVTKVGLWPVAVGLGAPGEDISRVTFSENEVAANNVGVSVGVGLTCPSQVPTGGGGPGMVTTNSDWWLWSNVVSTQQVIAGSASVLVRANQSIVHSNFIVGGDWGLMVSGDNAGLYNNAVTGSVRGIAVVNAVADLGGNYSTEPCVLACGATASNSSTNNFPPDGECH